MSAPLQRLRGHFVMLRADTLRLLLPQQDVGAARYLDSAEGALALQAVALSGEMRPLEACPPGRFLLIRLGDGGQATWFAWNEVRVMIDAELEPHELPDALRTSHSPLHGFVELEGEIAFLTRASQVLAHSLSTHLPSEG